MYYIYLYGNPSKTDILHDHLLLKHLELGRSLLIKYKIYLDTRFWIMLSEVHLGRSDDKNLHRLYSLLSDAVKNGSIICTFSESVYVEIFRQSDPTTRNAALAVMDSFSQGLILCNHFDRSNIELLHYLKTTVFNNQSFYDLKTMVWSKAPYVLGLLIPDNKQLAPEQNAIIQKSFFDYLWGMTITKFFTADESRHIESGLKIADGINLEKAKHAESLNSFQQVFMDEIAGQLSTIDDDLSHMLQHIIVDKKLYSGEVKPEEMERCQQLSKNVIYNLFQYEKMGERLPLMRIHAGCHAAVRWDKSRNFRDNDFMDFHHACAALPYCDLFMTDGPFEAILDNRQLGFDKIYRCKVTSRVDTAINIIESFITNLQQPD